MGEKLWTKADLAKFDRLTKKLSSLRQMDRLNARFAINRFIDEHGREKCDAMFAHLKARDAKAGR